MNPPPRLSDGENGQRSPHDEGRFVGMMLMASVFAEERQEEGAEDVESGHAGGEEADPEDPRRVFVGRFENRSLLK